MKFKFINCIPSKFDFLFNIRIILLSMRSSTRRKFDDLFFITLLLLNYNTPSKFTNIKAYYFRQGFICYMEYG